MYVYNNNTKINEQIGSNNWYTYSDCVFGTDIIQRTELSLNERQPIECLTCVHQIGDNFHSSIYAKSE